jgi:hypothetical protein
MKDAGMVQQGSIRQTQTQFDPILIEFLREKINTFVRWDLVRFFHDNPHAMDTAENIAHYTGRDTRSVETELMGLVEAGVLQLHPAAKHQVFSLSPDPTIRDLMNRFVLACDNRHFRVQAINEVVRRMRR